MGGELIPQCTLCLAPRPDVKPEFYYIYNKLIKVLNIFSPEDLGLGSKLGLKDLPSPES